MNVVRAGDHPPGWKGTTLGSLGHYWNGRGFRKSEWRESGRPIIRIQNLTGSGEGFNYFQGEADDRNIVRRGDLLVSWAATLGVYLWDGPEAVLNQHIFKVESFIDKHFHRYLLESVLADLKRQTHGSGIVHITRGSFEETEVWIPPAKDQRAIVSALERQLDRVAIGARGVQRATSKTDALERSLLVHAFRAVSLSESRTVRLDQISEVRLGRQRSPKNHTGHHMKSYLRAANIGWTGLLLQDVKQMNFAPVEQEVYRLRREDILLSEASGSPAEVGKSAIWLGELDDCYFQNTLIRVRVAQPDVDARYLRGYFRMLALTGAFARASRGVGIHHLGAQTLASWELPLPSRADQRRLIARLDESLTTVSKMRSELRVGLARATQLRRAILAVAFTGRLPIGTKFVEPGSMNQAALIAAGFE